MEYQISTIFSYIHMVMVMLVNLLLRFESNLLWSVDPLLKVIMNNILFTYHKYIRHFHLEKVVYKNIKYQK